MTISEISIKKFFLSLATLLSFLMLYSNYFFGVEQGVVNGGQEFRLAIKVGIFSIFLCLMILYSKVTAHRFIVFLFFLYISMKNILALPYITEELWQIFNVLFFLPLIFLNLKRNELRFWLNFVASIALIMLVIEGLNPYRAFDNRGISGGVGNPSSFATLLLISSLIMNRNEILSSALRLSTVFTGAAFPTLLAYVYQFVFIERSLIRFILNGCIILALGLLIIVFKVESSLAIFHMMGKLEALFSGNWTGSASISLRVDYIIRGFSKFTENVPHVLIGSLDDEPIITGDGYFITLIATYGLVGVLFFLSMMFSSNFWRSSEDHLVGSCRRIIVVFIFMFLVNRILDYWPMAMLFIVCIVYSRKSESDG